MRAARLDKSALASPRTIPHSSAFLQVVVAVFWRPGRDDNGNVETKPVRSGLLHTVLFKETSNSSEKCFLYVEKMQYTQGIEMLSLLLSYLNVYFGDNDA